MQKLSQTEELARSLAAKAHRHTLTTEQISRAMEEADFDIAQLDELYAALEQRGVHLAEEPAELPVLDDAQIGRLENELSSEGVALDFHHILACKTMRRTHQHKERFIHHLLRLRLHHLTVMNGVALGLGQAPAPAVHLFRNSHTFRPAQPDNAHTAHSRRCYHRRYGLFNHLVHLENGNILYDSTICWEKTEENGAKKKC